MKNENEINFSGVEGSVSINYPHARNRNDFQLKDFIIITLFGQM
jgi:hypothetical protein